MRCTSVNNRENRDIRSHKSGTLTAHIRHARTTVISLAYGHGILSAEGYSHHNVKTTMNFSHPLTHSHSFAILSIKRKQPESILRLKTLWLGIKSHLHRSSKLTPKTQRHSRKDIDGIPIFRAKVN